jgi:WD40 repeat protein
MELINMKHKMFLFGLMVLISTYSLFAQELKEKDTNVMWTYENPRFYSYPSVLPNGNILISAEWEILEINGSTGNLIRKIPLPGPTSSIVLSKDGTRMAISGGIYDVATGKLIKAHPGAKSVKFLHPFNNKIIYIPYNQVNERIVIYDYLTEESNILDIDYYVTAIEVSPDGKYLAIACKYPDNNNSHTIFYLYDAQTMELTSELEKVVSDGRTIDLIQFSENSKYVGYGQIAGVKPKATFFTCETPFKKWEIPNTNLPPYGMGGLGFVNDDYTFLSLNTSIETKESILYDINADKIIYRTNKYGSYYPIYNKVFNSLLVWGFSNQSLVSLDFNKLLNSVSVNEPNEDQTKFQAEYCKGILCIKNYETTSILINITINDLQGKIVFTQQILSGSNIILVPVNLINGVYILQIQDVKQNYSQKFLVFE